MTDPASPDMQITLDIRLHGHEVDVESTLYFNGGPMVPTPLFAADLKKGVSALLQSMGIGVSEEGEE